MTEANQNTDFTDNSREIAISAPEKKPRKILFLSGLAGILIIIISAFIVSQKIKEKTSVTTKAGENKATVTLQPAESNIPPNANIQIWMSVDNPAGFAHIELTFDPAKIKLAENPAIATENPFHTTVINTSKDEANSTGTVQIVTALSVEDKDNPATGTYKMANLVFEANTSAPDTSAEITLADNNIQIVGMDTAVFAVVTENAQINLNTAASESPTVTPAQTPSSTPTSSIIQTPSPTPSASPTLPPGVTPTITPSPTAGKIQGDLNDDNQVDIYDYNVLVEHFGETGEPGFIPADINMNGKVDIYDYNKLVENFGL